MKSSQKLILLLFILLNLNCQKSSDLVGCWQGIENGEYLELVISDVNLMIVKSFRENMSHFSFPKEQITFSKKIKGRRNVKVKDGLTLHLISNNKLKLEATADDKKIIEFQRIECGTESFHAPFSLSMHEYRKRFISREVDYIEQFGDLDGQSKSELRKQLLNQEKNIYNYYQTLSVNPEVEGIYEIDTTKENVHSYKHFQFSVSKKHNYFEMKFISCEEYGYSSLWKKGDTYGYIDSIKNKKENIYSGRINEHRGADKLELTEHLIQVRKNEIIIFTGKYKDHYKKIKE